MVSHEPYKAISFYYIAINHAIKQGLTLAKHERLKSRKLLEQLFREGTTFFVHPFKVYYKIIGDVTHPVQAGFGVSARTFKKAVERNRVKRLTREAYRLQKNNLQQMLEANGKNKAVFFLYTGKELPAYELIKDKMRLVLQQLENRMTQ